MKKREMEKRMQKQMQKQMQKGNEKAIAKAVQIKCLIDQVATDEQGMGMVEIALIVLVVIALSVIFKDQMETLLKEVFGKATVGNY